QVPVQRLLQPENVIRFDRFGERDTVVYVIGRIHVEHEQGVANGLPTGADAHEFFVHWQSAGLQLDGAIPGGYELTQLFGTGSQGSVLDVVAASRIGQDVLAGAAAEPVESILEGVPLLYPTTIS